MEGISPRKTQSAQPSTFQAAGGMSARVLISDLEAVSEHPLQHVKSLAHGEISTCWSYFDYYLNFFWSWKLWRHYWLTDLFKYEKHDSLRKWLTQKQVVLKVFKKDNMLVLMTEGSYYPLNILLGPDPGMSIHLIFRRTWQDKYGHLLQTDHIRFRETDWFSQICTTSKWPK